MPSSGCTESLAWRAEVRLHGTTNLSTRPVRPATFPEGLYQGVFMVCAVARVIGLGMGMASGRSEEPSAEEGRA
jgi:hypothetical protein